MFRRKYVSALSALLALLVLVGETACSAKNLPRKQRKPEISQPENPSTEQHTPTGSAKGGGSVEVPIQETAKPGETVSVLGAPVAKTFAFVPQRQESASSADRYASSLKGTTGHPRLYFDSNELLQLQTLASTSHKDIAKRIFAYGDRKSRQKNSLPPKSVSGMGKSTGSWRKVGDRLLGIAAAYAYSSDPAKKQKYLDWCTEALRRLSTFPKWGPTPEYDIGLDGTHLMLGYAIALDVVYSELNSSDQKQFAERLRLQASRYYKETQKKDSAFWVDAKNVNHNYSNHNALLNAALVLENHYPEAKTWIALVVENADRVMKFREMVGDGSTHEGLMYASYGSHGLFATLDLLKKHRLADHFDNTWLREHFSYYLHGTRPGWSRVIGVSDGHGFFGHGPHHLLYFMDRVMRDGRPTWASDRIRDIYDDSFPFGKPEGSTLFFELLWRDSSISARKITPENTPTFHHFEDWGVMTFRRSWNANSTFFSFRAGDPPGHAIWKMMLNKDPRVGEPLFSHSHPDAGSFSFYPNGRDFISGAVYEMPKRTALENTYTFTPKGHFDSPVPLATAKKMWDADKLHQVGKLDELGQVGEWNRWYGPAKAILKAKVHAEIVTAVEMNGAVFTSAEIAGAYPKSYKTKKKKRPFGLERLYRNMILLPEDVLVIIDRVQTKGPLETHCYFRSESTPKVPVLWSAKGDHAELQSSKLAGSIVDLVHPTGMKMDTGLEIYSWEDAKGDNKGGIKDWSQVAQSSAYVRVTNAEQNGIETYVYVLRPKGKAARVFDLDLKDPRGVSLKIEIGKRVYSAKVAMDLTSANRMAFLGFDGHCKLDYTLQ